ncbi:hypothetical protein [Microbulbifer yueqingensis]|uniref:Uncharacterized protein n=1 Tax=Microbulbifer yueqingensis TaxID=658219 RepID=A0A1G9C1A2_9GAMM|nr:hypothetical protein [Microbulbifer yueqingensis]SDK45408.1 hypothetical protein SAMN05216212_2439 [Microbulbifer yueqingensis]
MSSWITALCVIGALLSLLLVARRQASRGRRVAAGLLQSGIWLVAWMLAHPPALLPAPQHAELAAGANAGSTRAAISPALSDRELAGVAGIGLAGPGHYRDSLLALPPLRLQLEVPVADGWRPRWPRRLLLGESLTLEINTGAHTPAGVPLALVDPFGERVAEAVTGEAGSTVQLSDLPRLAGRWEYRLQVGEGATARSEPVPVTVEAGERPRVLLWLARPGFESAALSRWLRQSGVPARVVTRLAPGIERNENLNGLEAGSGAPLDMASEFELLILDSHLWPLLDSGQRRALEVMARSGGSVLWLVGEDSPAGFLEYAARNDMALQPAAAVQVSAPNGDRDTPPLALSGYRPATARETDSLLGDDSPASLYWGRQSADGALGFVFFHNSYRWMTAGQRGAFARLWQSVLEPQLAHLGHGQALEVREPLPRAGHRVTLCRDDFGQPPALAGPAGSGVLPGAPAGRRCHAYWPEEPGWHQLAGDDGSVHAFYVFPAEAWPDWQRALMRDESRQMATARLGPEPATAAPGRPLPRPWLALLLVMLLALAWWGERKLKP